MVPLEAAVRLGQVVTPDPALVAQDPDQASLSSRLTNRLWALCGANATTVEVRSSDPVTSVHVVARDDDAALAIAGPCRPVASPPRRRDSSSRPMPVGPQR